MEATTMLPESTVHTVTSNVKFGSDLHFDENAWQPWTSNGQASLLYIDGIPLHQLLDRIRQQLDSLKSVTVLKSEKIASLEKSVQSLEEKKEEKKTAIDEQRIAIMENNMAALERSISTMREDYNNHTSELRKEKLQVEEEKKAMQAEIKILSENNEKLTKRCQDYEELFTELRNENTQQNGRQEEFEKELDSTKSEISQSFSGLDIKLNDTVNELNAKFTAQDTKILQTNEKLETHIVKVTQIEKNTTYSLNKVAQIRNILDTTVTNKIGPIEESIEELQQSKVDKEALKSELFLKPNLSDMDEKVDKKDFGELNDLHMHLANIVNGLENNINIRFEETENQIAEIMEKKAENVAQWCLQTLREENTGQDGRCISCGVPSTIGKDNEYHSKVGYQRKTVQYSLQRRPSSPKDRNGPEVDLVLVNENSQDDRGYRLTNNNVNGLPKITTPQRSKLVRPGAVLNIEENTSQEIHNNDNGNLKIDKPSVSLISARVIGGTENSTVNIVKEDCVISPVDDTELFYQNAKKNNDEKKKFRDLEKRFNTGLHVSSQQSQFSSLQKVRPTTAPLRSLMPRSFGS